MCWCWNNLSMNLSMNSTLQDILCVDEERVGWPLLDLTDLK